MASRIMRNRKWFGRCKMFVLSLLYRKHLTLWLHICLLSCQEKIRTNVMHTGIDYTDCTHIMICPNKFRIFRIRLISRFQFIKTKI